MEDRRWYVCQTYSGYENSVKLNLERRIESMQMEDCIYQVMIPEEIRIEKKADGSTKEKLHKIFPGYVFIEMSVTDDSWFVVRNTPGVTGFLGSSGGGTKPVPLPPEEINPILKKAGLMEIPKFEIEVGEKVRVITGPFSNQIGTLDSVDEDHQAVTVLVDMFGRQTPVELSFEDVQKL